MAANFAKLPELPGRLTKLTAMRIKCRCRGSVAT